jgi:hypothetical protein
VGRPHLCGAGGALGFGVSVWCSVCGDLGDRGAVEDSLMMVLSLLRRYREELSPGEG